MPGKPSDAALRIRYYVLAKLRKTPNSAEVLPSCGALAERFGTTKRVAQYELAHLVSMGILVSKPRVGFMLNPKSSAGWFYKTEKERLPFATVIYGDGQYFSLGCTAQKMLSALFASLADSGCGSHFFHHLGKTEDSLVEDLSSASPDAVIWVVKGDQEEVTSSLLAKLKRKKIPVILYGFSRTENCINIVPDWENALASLGKIMKEKNVRRALTYFPAGVKRPEIERVFPENCIHEETALPPKKQIDHLRRCLRNGQVPGMIFCEDGMILPVQELLREFSIDPEGRIVSFYPHGFHEPFTGYVFIPDYRKMADLVCGLLYKAVAGPLQDQTISVPASLYRVRNGSLEDLKTPLKS